ncbi:MAG: wax ester/triacylglycerol synthase domain-containing protein [Streptosporangiaceae bacterium]
MAGSVDRASALDMMELATDFGPVPMQVGAVLVFEAGTGLDARAVRDVLAARTCGIPRLRQRLMRAPPGCGRPVWVDDTRFDVSQHIAEVSCSPPGDEAALLQVAADLVSSPLPAGRPPWAATLVTGLADQAPALIVVFHHVLADGMGGLAVLASLVDGAVPGDDGALCAGPVDFPRPAPSSRQLAADAAGSRLRAVRHLARAPAQLRDALSELRPRATGRASRCSLNRPVGARRKFAVTRAELAQVRAAGRDCDGTVNDVVLAAVGDALTALLASRGERADRFVVSVPVSGRGQATAVQLGNQVGIIPVPLPTAGSLTDRVRVIAEVTRRRKTQARGASAALFAPTFRLLAALGVLRWLSEHQDLVTTFVTNLRGPDAPVWFAGAKVREVIPLNAVTGNVTVAFAVMSYSAVLTVTVIADADAVPDVGLLAAALQSALDRLALNRVPAPDV